MQTFYVLRKVGTSSFAFELPHDFDEKNFVDGWENLRSRALHWKTVEEAEDAKASDPDGYALTIEGVS